MKPKREEPFLITKVLGPVTYRLQLPATWRIQDVLLRGTCERRWETLLRDCERIEQGIRQLESEVSNCVIGA